MPWTGSIQPSATVLPEPTKDVRRRLRRVQKARMHIANKGSLSLTLLSLKLNAAIEGRRGQAFELLDLISQNANDGTVLSKLAG